MRFLWYFLYRPWTKTSRYVGTVRKSEEGKWNWKNNLWLPRKFAIYTEKSRLLFKIFLKKKSFPLQNCWQDQEEGTKYFQCPACNKNYKNSSHLFRHERNCSNNEFQTVYPCESCIIRTLTEHGFEIHRARFHPEIHVSEKSDFRKIYYKFCVIHLHNVSYFFTGKESEKENPIWNYQLNWVRVLSSKFRTEFVHVSP
jgi:hypothetical protein